MDNLCHTLAGAALGEAGLRQRTAGAMATLMLASNLPDIDVAVFLTDTLPMSFRRGWTHGVLALALLPALFALLMFGWQRWRRRTAADGTAAAGPASHPDPSQPPLRLGGLMLLAYLGTWLHVFMDWLNSYGVRLLMPFSNRWFYGDALFIVDPFLYVFFVAAIVLARRARRQGRRAPSTWARRAVAVAAAYMLVMLVANWWGVAEVRAGLARAGREGARFMVTPVAINPFRREVVVDTGTRYEKGQLWFEPAPHFRPAGFGVETNLTSPEAKQAAQHPRAQAFLRWARFPYFHVERTAQVTRVWLNDYRYSGSAQEGGWSVQSFELPRE